MSAGGDRYRRDVGSIAELSETFQAHVTAADGPLVVLLEEEGADQPFDGRFIGEDGDDIRTPFDFAIDPLDRIGRMDLRP